MTRPGPKRKPKRLRHAKVSVSLMFDVNREGRRRARKLRAGSFSAYINGLIQRDLKRG